MNSSRFRQISVLLISLLYTTGLCDWYAGKILITGKMRIFILKHTLIREQ